MSGDVGGPIGLAPSGQTQTLDSLLVRLTGYLPPEVDLDPVRLAYRWAERGHAGQQRLSGEPYLVHPLAVAHVLADLHLDRETVVAGLLHDVVEDTPITLEEVSEEFGLEVAALVDGVTKLSQIRFRSMEEEQANNLRKMLLAMAKDVRVILIKLADRLHNMRTLRFLPADRRQEIARETVEIFAPLAHRLGISQIKWELEDLSFRTLEPEVYQALRERVSARRRERQEFIDRVITTLRQELSRAGIEAEVDGRPKNFYSIYRKMQRGREFEEIFDLNAIRIRVNTVRECYGAVGIAHHLWRPLPGRFKDYVAMPKPNLYQSLHTSVVGPEGQPFEVQIRTWDMHRTAEYGIAAHWLYKEGKQPDTFDDKLAWLRRVLDWQHDLKDAREFMESLRIDLFSDQVFVFTPKGSVIDLPAGSTPIDFAYRIHTDVGHHAAGARANGRMVPLDYRLQNGDIVEIQTGRQSVGPSADWLEFVRTSGARQKIRQFLRNQNRQERIQAGLRSLEKEAHRLGLEPSVLMTENLLPLARKYNFSTVEELFLAIAQGGLAVGSVLPKPEPTLPIDRPGAEERVARDREAAPAGVHVEGIEHPLVRFARCCQPVPGDPILGYVTRGRGVSIHHARCSNAAALCQDPDRLLEVTWAAETARMPVELTVNAQDRAGLLADLAQAVSDLHLNIYSATAHSGADGRAVVELTVEIRHLGELGRLENRLDRVNGVLSVVRPTHVRARVRRRVT